MLIYMETESPLKSANLFVWLLLRQKLVTRVFKKKMFQGASAECILCTGGKEDGSQLVF